MAEFTQIYSERKRNTLIKKEKARLSNLFKNIETSQFKVAEKLIDDAAFMSITLEELKKIICRDGVVEQYQNGENQKGNKKSAAAEVYDKMINTYAKTVKQMCDLVPERVVFTPEDDEVDPGEEIMGVILENKKYDT